MKVHNIISLNRLSGRGNGRTNMILYSRHSEKWATVLMKYWAIKCFLYFDMRHSLFVVCKYKYVHFVNCLWRIYFCWLSWINISGFSVERFDLAIGYVYNGFGWSAGTFQWPNCMILRTTRFGCNQLLHLLWWCEPSHLVHLMTLLQFSRVWSNDWHREQPRRFKLLCFWTNLSERLFVKFVW